MMRRSIAIGALALLLGLLAGGITGYRLGCAASAEEPLSEGPRDPFSQSSGETAFEETATDNSQPEVRIVEVEDDSTSMDEPFRQALIPSIDMQGNNLMDLISVLQCRSYELNRESGGIHIAIGHPLVHDPEFSNIEVTLQAANASVKEILDTVSEQTGIVYTIRPCAVFWGKGESKRAENDESAKP